MKLNIKSFAVLIILMIGSLAAKADPTINIKKLLNGSTVNESTTVGDITTQIADGKCTITVQPASGNYITAENITYIKTINGSHAQTRTPSLDNTSMTVTALTPNDDPSSETKYEFALKDVYDYEITADFQSRKSIANATITVEKDSYTYTGEAIEPSVTVKLGEITLTYQTDFTLAYSNNLTVGNGTVTITGQRTYTGSADTTFTITPASMTVSASGYEGTYDGKAHGISVTAPEGATVMYGTTKGTYELTASPTYTNAGTYKVHYQVTQDNFTTITDSATVEITLASMTVSASGYEGTYDGKAHGISVTAPEGATVMYGTKKGTYELTASPTYTNAGTYKVHYQVTQDNFTTITDSATVEITLASMTVSASGYEGTYDGKAHGISVTAPEGATVMYGTQEGTYDLTASPTFTDAGTYQVYYQVSKENYTPVTGSKTVEISKAAGGLAYSAATASAELNGDGWTAPSLSNPHGLDITYSSSNTDVATVSTTGVVTLTGIGQTTIKATTAGNENYTASEAQYELTVSRGKAKSYGVKIGDTEVDEDNYSDIFGDNGTDNGDYKRVAPSMLFNPEDNTLLIIGSNEGLTIESTLPELKIHLSNDNKLKKVVFNNQGNSANTGKLQFTCDSNFPGKLTIENTEGESAISGFANISYEFGLQPLSPEDAKYQNGKMVDGNGAAASTVVIGTVLNPLTGDEPENLNPDDFTVTYPDGTTATVDLTNNTINNILYTLNNETEGQGYDPDFNDIGIVTTMTDETVNQIADDVANNNLIMGSDDYANRFIGLTFIVQGGEGIVKLDQEVVEGYEFHLKMGDKAAIKIVDYITPQLYAEVPYQFDDATFCWLYLVKKPGASSRRSNTRVNKRDKLMGTIKQVKVKAKSVASTNSAAKASGGKITPTVNSAITGIEEIQVDSETSNHMKNDKWYTLDGRQIDKPSQKGIYIKNEKKVVIK